MRESNPSIVHVDGRALRFGGTTYTSVSVAGFATAFQAYQEKRYLRTGRAQIMARVYGEVSHASGIARELRNAL
jgi:hypothetical protein